MHLPQTFNAAAMAPTQREHLESLLDQIDGAAADFRSFCEKGYIAALMTWLRNPPRAMGCLQNGEKAWAVTLDEMYTQMPDDRYEIVIKELEKSCDHTDTPELFAPFSALDRAEKNLYLAYIDLKKDEALDPREGAFHRRKLAKLYRAILTEFPGILLSKQDAQNYKTAVRSFKTNGDTLKSAFQKQGKDGIDTTATAFLKSVFPTEPVGEMLVSELQKPSPARGLFQTETSMLFTTQQLKNTSAEDFMCNFMHEFQHFRQLVQIRKLEDGKLKKGSAAYYQARLFRANFRGGYLPPPPDGNPEGFHSYHFQPVEAQANQMMQAAETLKTAP